MRRFQKTSLGRSSFSASGASVPLRMEKVKVQRTGRIAQKELFSEVRPLRELRVGSRYGPGTARLLSCLVVRSSLLFEKAFNRTHSLTHSLFGSMHSSRPTIHFAGFGGGCPALPSSSRFARAASSSRFRHSC